MIPLRKKSTPAKPGTAAHFQEARNLPDLKERVQDEMNGNWWQMSEDWVLSVLPDEDVSTVVDAIVADLYDKETGRWRFSDVDHSDCAEDNTASPTKPSGDLSELANTTENTSETLVMVSGPTTPVLDVAHYSDEASVSTSPRSAGAASPEVPAASFQPSTTSGKPRREQHEKKLYKPFVNLFSDMLRKADRFHCRRVVEKADKYERHHSNISGTNLRSSVDLLVLGAMPQINGFTQEKNDFGSDPFKDMAASTENAVLPIEVKTDPVKGRHQHHPQCGVYAREQLKKQPNRHFCFLMLLTEEHVRVYLFTRSGAFHSPWLNIHKDPSRFAKIFLGLTTLNVAALGFNPSIVKESGQLVYYHKFLDPTVQGERFLVYRNKPWVRRYNICGRGTTCWYLVLPTTCEGGQDEKDIIVKEAWPSTHREHPEAYFLRQAEGLDGVGQMYSEDLAPEENALDTVSAIAKVPAKVARTRRYVNRKRTRLFLDAYQGDVSKFRKRSQFVQAMIDAINGHRRLLLLRNILHRDISIANIVLGEFECILGNRGRIIDLDLAVEIKRDGSITEGTRDVRTGTFQFISVNLLHDEPREHTYLDDLQSFFWVIMVVCLTRMSDDYRDKNFKNDALLNSWASSDNSVTRTSKDAFLTSFKKGRRPLRYRLAPYMKDFDASIRALARVCLDLAMEQEQLELSFRSRCFDAERKSLATSDGTPDPLEEEDDSADGCYDDEGESRANSDGTPDSPQEEEDDSADGCYDAESESLRILDGTSDTPQEEEDNSADAPDVTLKDIAVNVEPTRFADDKVNADYDKFLDILKSLEAKLLALEEQEENAKAGLDKTPSPEVSVPASGSSAVAQEDVFGQIIHNAPRSSTSTSNNRKPAGASQVQASRAPKRASGSIEGGPSPAPNLKRQNRSREQSGSAGA